VNRGARGYVGRWTRGKNVQGNFHMYNLFQHYNIKYDVFYTINFFS
jgi:hypothetical protein